MGQGHFNAHRYGVRPHNDDENVKVCKDVVFSIPEWVRFWTLHDAISKLEQAMEDEDITLTKKYINRLRSLRTIY